MLFARFDNELNVSSLFTRSIRLITILHKLTECIHDYIGGNWKLWNMYAILFKSFFFY